MTSNSTLSKTFGLSLLLHGSLLAVLVFLGTRPPAFSDRPLRVRILEPPAPERVPPPIQAPQVGPKAVAPAGESREPRAERQKSEDRRQRAAGSRQEETGEPGTPRVAESRDGGSGASGTSEKPRLDQPSSPPPPLPLVAARPALEPMAPSTQRVPELPREAPPLTAPERSGLSLRGPPPGTPALSRGKTALPSGPARPSLRDQIASLGSGLRGDPGDIAKQTINLDSRNPEFVPYLARVTQRIQREWVYPEEAWSRGVRGELLLVFTLNKNGSMTNLRLVQSSGFPILDQEALRAVKEAAPYDPFPPQMGEESWNIAASFHYNLPHRFQRN